MRNCVGSPGRKREARRLLATCEALAGVDSTPLVESIAELLRRREHGAYLYALHVVDDAETKEAAVERLREIVGATDAA